MWDTDETIFDIEPIPSEAWDTGRPDTTGTAKNLGSTNIKLKIPIDEFLYDSVGLHMAKKRPDLAEKEYTKFPVGEKIFVYVEVNSFTGEVTVVGCDGHPLNKFRWI